MKDEIILSVLIVGEGSDITPSLRASLEAIRAARSIEALFVNTSAGQDYLSSGSFPCSTLNGFELSYRECITQALDRLNGEWIIILSPQESLLPDALEKLLNDLRTSVPGIRHGDTSVFNEDGHTTLRPQTPRQCTYPLVARWWLTQLHPDCSALFMRKALLVRALHNTSHHATLSRYAVALGATRCCSSEALDLYTSTATLSGLDKGADETTRLDIVRQEISVHSLPEQSSLWRDYYISRLTEPQLHTTPTLLPYSAAQAYALASLLGEIKMPMAEALWSLYQDIPLSKRAVMYLSCWSSITSTTSTALSGSQQDAPLRELLCEELKHDPTTKILLLSQNLTQSPLASLLQLLRDEGRHGATLYTVSYNEEEYRPLFADLAHRGLLGWVRPAIATKLRPSTAEEQATTETSIDHFTIEQRMPQRALGPILDNSQSNLDYIIAHVEDPFLTAEVSHLAENVKSPYSILLLGRITASTLGPIEASIRRHRQVTSMVSHGEVTVVRCEALERPL